MENTVNEIDLMALFKDLWNQRYKLIKWGAVGFLVGIVVAYSIPKEYVSSVRIAPESNSSKGVMNQLGGMAAIVGINTGGSNTSGINESVYPEIVKSAPFLGEFTAIEIPYKEQKITLMKYLTEEQKKAWWSYVINAPIAFAGWVFSSPDKGITETEDPTNPSSERRQFEEELSRRMSIVADKKTDLITMSVKMQDSKIAMIVADSLLEKLSRYMTDYYTAKARKDLQMSQDMLVQVKQSYYKSDSAYAAAMDRNQNLISKSAQVKIERYKNERDIAYMAYQQMASQVEANKIKLQEDSPIATVIEPSRIMSSPVSPNKKLIIVAMAFIGFMAAVALIVVKTIVRD